MKNILFLIFIYILMAIIFPKPSISQLQDSPWPKFRHDLQNNGQSPYSGPQMPGRILKNKIDIKIVSSPAIGKDGTVYIGTWYNGLMALNSDLSKKWSTTTYAAVPSSPAIDLNGIIYAASWNYDLFAILSDGSEKWRFHTGRDIKSSPSIGTDGTIYFGSADSNFYAITPECSLKWNYKAKDWITYSSPAIDASGTIYIVSWDRNLYAFDPESPLPKKPKWTYRSGGNISSSPAIGSDGTIYIHVFKATSELHAVNPDSTNKWICQTNGHKINDDYPHSSPAIGIDGTIYIGSNDQKLYAITPDGVVKWSYETEAPVRSSAAIGADGKIYFGSDDGFYALKPDGNLKWRYHSNRAVRSSAAIGNNGQLYVSSFNGTIHAFLGDHRAPLKDITADSLNLENDASYWGIYCEGAPEWILENVTGQSLEDTMIHCGITGGDYSYSNVHCYRNLPPNAEADSFYMSLNFWFDRTSFNDDTSIVQALEFTMNKWQDGKRYEWALQWQNVGEGAPQWRYWDPHQTEKWVGQGIKDSLEGNKWHRLEMIGIIDTADRVHYLEFIIDSLSRYKIDRIKVEPALVPGEEDRLAIAFQIDGNKFMSPYDMLVDSVCFFSKKTKTATNSHQYSNDSNYILDYDLSQNYPNPFNPSTTIHFTLPWESEVLLQIFNIKGEIICTLEQRKLPRGKHAIIWNGHDKQGKQCPSGVYFCRLKAGDFTSVKKLTLLR